MNGFASKKNSSLNSFDLSSAQEWLSNFDFFLSLFEFSWTKIYFSWILGVRNFFLISITKRNDVSYVKIIVFTSKLRFKMAVDELNNLCLCFQYWIPSSLVYKCEWSYCWSVLVSHEAFHWNSLESKIRVDELYQLHDVLWTIFANEYKWTILSYELNRNFIDE